MRVVVAATLVWWVVLLAPPDAAACSCSAVVRAIPENGATGVPRNVVVLVWGTFEASQPELRALDGDGSTEVVVEVESWLREAGWASFWRARPVALLEPGAHAVLLGAETIATFEVDDHVDMTPPVFSGLSAMDAVSWHTTTDDCQNSCFSGTEFAELRLHHEALPDDAAYVIAEVRRADEAEPSWESPYPFVEPFVSPDTRIDFLAAACGVAAPPRFAPGVEYCARLTAYDTAGIGAGGEVERCSEAVACGWDVCADDVPAGECSDRGIEGDGEEGGCSAASDRTRAVPVLAILVAFLAGRQRRPRK